MQQEQEAQLPGAVHRERGADGDEVLEALAHLQPVDVQVAGVDEVVDPLLHVVVRLGLRQLVLVVREVEVDAAAVDIHSLAQDVAAHGAALDVPPRPPHAPRAVPRGLPRLAGLPQHEVELALLLRGVGGQGTLAVHGALHVVHSGFVELGVLVVVAVLKRRHVEVHGAVGVVREPLADDGVDVGDDLLGVLAHAGQHVGLGHT
mmetsp:Transcript_40206/g.99515  ORF Transcript_40206/g.99515 Transcript_40206/m.99515 type:complete len:204 (-) Transcript_40206:488-1099(-)